MFGAIASVGLSVVGAAMGASDAHKADMQSAAQHGRNAATAEWNAEQKRKALVESIPNVKANIINAMQLAETTTESAKADAAVMAAFNGTTGASVERVADLTDYEQNIKVNTIKEQGDDMFKNIGEQILGVNLDERAQKGNFTVNKRSNLAEFASIGQSLISNWEGLTE